MPRMNAVMERWGTDLPPRAARPDPDLGPGAPAARPARVRAVLQRPPASSGNRQRPATTRSALADPRADQCHPSLRPQTGPPRRHPPRVPACRLTCADEIFGKHSAGSPPGPRRALLAGGEDPQLKGRGESANLVWAARHDILTTALHTGLPEKVTAWPAAVRQLLGVNAGHRHGRFGLMAVGGLSHAGWAGR